MDHPCSGLCFCSIAGPAVPPGRRRQGDANLTYRLVTKEFAVEKILRNAAVLTEDPQLPVYHPETITNGALGDCSREVHHRSTSEGTAGRPYLTRPPFPWIYGFREASVDPNFLKSSFSGALLVRRGFRGSNSAQEYFRC